MPSVFDVAAYILHTHKSVTPSMTAMKLQKLVYYAQAWSTVWDGATLFPEKIEAWANGPVVVELYYALKGRFSVDEKSLERGDPASLSDDQRETVDRVVAFYGPRSPQYLSDLTHAEAPWLEARQGLAADDRSNREITPAAMAEYYENLR